MVFLWNNERVLVEVMTLARLLISRALGVHPRHVVAKAQLEGNKIIPEFGVETEHVPLSKLDSIGPVTRDIWRKRLRPDLTARLASTWMTRDDYQSKTA